MASHRIARGRGAALECAARCSDGTGDRQQRQDDDGALAGLDGGCCGSRARLQFHRGSVRRRPARGARRLFGACGRAGRAAAFGGHVRRPGDRARRHLAPRVGGHPGGRRGRHERQRGSFRRIRHRERRRSRGDQVGGGARARQGRHAGTQRRRFGLDGGRGTGALRGQGPPRIVRDGPCSSSPCGTAAPRRQHLRRPRRTPGAASSRRGARSRSALHVSADLRGRRSLQRRESRRRRADRRRPRAARGRHSSRARSGSVPAPRTIRAGSNGGIIEARPC